MAKVRLENVYKVYEGGVRAVNNFNLEIPDKEFVVFVGPSGCGKSTTLRMIAGLEDITQGKLYIDDEVVNDVESKNRDIAMVFQNYALYPHMTVYQNMSFGLKLRHTPKDEIDKRVKAAAEILEIDELLTRTPKALSGGQRQRVALGRAIVREPKVFLLDEPLSNLDAKLRVQMRSEITKLHDRLKTTFIYVTHDQTEAMTMGTRIVVMKDGFIQQVDSPVALFEEPANLFVATFLGSPQMNILNAKLAENGKGMNAILVDASAQPVLEFSDIRRKQLVNDSYLNKDVKLGIRPEGIEVSPDGNIDATIEVVEQLGDETIIYCSIPGIKQNIIVKTPFKGRVETKQNVKLKFDMDKVHLFDVDSTESILGMRSYNHFPTVVYGNGMKIGENIVDLPEKLKESILPSYFGKNVTLSCEVNNMSVEPIEDCFKLPIQVEFLDQKTDYISAYFKVKGLDQYFVVKLKNGTTKKPDCVYIPVKNLNLYNEDRELVNSREVMHPNSGVGVVERNKGTLYVHCFGTRLAVEDKPEYADLNGNVEVTIDPEGPVVLFNKKLLKSNPNKNDGIPKSNLIKFEAYDEHRSNKKNFIYGAVKGAENYFTLYVDNDFSVYAMDKFSVYIPPEAISLKAI